MCLRTEHRQLIPRCHYKAAFFSLMFLFFPLFSLSAQDLIQIDDLMNMSLEELMRVKVTVGARGEAKTVSQSMAPVHVIQAADLELSGHVTTGEALRSLLPAFAFYRTSITDGTDHLAPVSLKGLATDQLLVLINGKRWHPSAMLHVNATVGRGSTSIDFDALPLSSIQRIEVLPDGASAQYGSDAIAGIINIILKSDFTSSLAHSQGQTSTGDGRVRAETVNLKLESASAMPSRLGVFAEYKDRGAVNRSGIYPRQQYFDGDPRNDDPAVARSESFRYGEAQSRDFNGIFQLDHPLDEDLSFYAFGLLSYRQGKSGGFFRRALDDRTVRALYPDGFLPLITPDIQDRSLVAGLKTTDVAGWKADVALNLSTNRFDFNVSHSLNTSYGAQSPMDFYCGSQKYDQVVLTLDLFKNVSWTLADDLALGIGMEYRRENYEVLAGEPASYANGGVPILDGPNQGQVAPVGAQVYPGYTPNDAVSAGRTSVAAYMDMEQSISKPIRIGLAGRYERYSDFGQTFNGKASIHLQASDRLTLRSAASTGFRAPALAQSYFTATSSVYTAGNFYDVGTYGVYHALAQALGAEPLKPEKSRHLSLGVQYYGDNRLSIQANGYYIELRDRITITEDFVGDATLFGPDVPVILQSFGVAGARFFTNAVDTKTWGFDLSLQTQWDVGQSASLQLNAAHHYSATQIMGDLHAPAYLEGYLSALVSTNDITRLTDVQPSHITHGTIALSLPRWMAQAKLFRYGDFWGDLYQEEQRSHYGAKWLVDLVVKYKVCRHFHVQAIGHNVLDTYPDRRSGDDIVANVLPYPQYSPFGFRGASYAMKFTYFL